MLLWLIEPKIDWNRLLPTIKSRNLVAIMIVSNSDDNCNINISMFSNLCNFPLNVSTTMKVAFTSLTLFNTLRGPLFLLPYGIASLIQGAVAIGRISRYLNEEEIDESQVS